MANYDIYSKNLRIHRMMGLLITTTIVYLIMGGFLLGAFFYLPENNISLLVLLAISVLYMVFYTTLAITFRKLAKDNKLSKRDLNLYLIFSF